MPARWNLPDVVRCYIVEEFAKRMRQNLAGLAGLFTHNWAMGNGQWAVGSGKWAVDNGQWPMANDLLPVLPFYTPSGPPLNIFWRPLPLHAQLSPQLNPKGSRFPLS